MTRKLTREEVLEELRLEEELARRKEYDVLGRLAPNKRQWDFINCHTHETLFSGLNQAGKSTALCIKAAYHLTGLYPPDYVGVKFEKPINAAIGGETAQSTRDLLCERLLGPTTERGSGYIPANCFEPSEDIKRLGGGITDQVDFFRVKHFGPDGKFNGHSRCYVFSYSTGWQRLQGYTLNWIGIDEEPPFPVYDEFSARLNATDGYMDISMTPLQGETELYLMFEESEDLNARIMLNYDIDDALHMTDENRTRLMKKYANHPLAEARLYGRPVRGAGLIYTVPDELLYIEDFIIPSHWKQIIGLDFPHSVGTFAAAKLAYDEQNDVLYLTSEYKEAAQETFHYAHRVAAIGGHTVPCAWPHDAGRGFTDGSTVSERYRDCGLNMLKEFSHFINPEGKKTFAIMQVIEEICDRMASGRFRVFMTCSEFTKEKRRYKHAKGKVAKLQDDHIIDAVHKAVMMLRFARPQEEQKAIPKRLPVLDFFSDF